VQTHYVFRNLVPPAKNGMRGGDWIQLGGSSAWGHNKVDTRVVNELFDALESELKLLAALVWDDWFAILIQRPLIAKNADEKDGLSSRPPTQNAKIAF
jgi:hypothetical protein